MQNQSTDSPTVSLRDQTDVGRVLGTVGYMSPEQVRGDPADTRSDIFALGCVVYEMLTGNRAFRKPTSVETMHAILNEDPQPASDITRTIPPALERVVHRCLEKVPARRFQSASDLAFALDALSGSGISSSDIRYQQFSVTAKRHRSTLVNALFAVVTAAISAFLVWHFLPGRNMVNRLFKKFEMMRVTNGENVAWADISPDGTYVAFSADEVDNASIWMTHLPTGSTARVLGPTTSQLGSGIRFTRSGHYFYFEKTKTDGSTVVLYRLPVLGGTPKPIVENVEGGVGTSPDGKRIVFARHTFNPEQNQLLTADAEGGSERAILTLAAATETIGLPAWSPDGKVIAFGIDETGIGNKNTLAYISPEGGKETRVLKTVGISGIAWLPDQSGLLITAWVAGFDHSSVWVVSYPDGRMRRVGDDLSSYLGVGLSAAGDRLVTVQKQIDSSLWVAPANDPTSAIQLRENAGRLDGIEGVMWLGENRLVFADGQLRSEICVANRDGSHRQRLTQSDHASTDPAGMRSGNKIVFSRGEPESDIWIADSDGGNAKQLTRAPGSKWNPEISPDGAWITYVTEDAPWKMRLDEGTPVRLDPATSGRYPTISPDGRWIAFQTWDDHAKIFKVEVISSEGTGPPRFLPSVPDSQVPASTNMGPLPIRWTADGKAITYVRTENGVSNLWRQPVDGSPAKQITHFTSMLIWRHAWSPDGKYLALARGNFSRDAVTLTDLR